MTSGPRRAATLSLAFIVFAVIIDETNAKPPLRIANGKEAKPGDYKWMVSLSPEFGISICGGAIIGPRHILTAAHCIVDLKPEDLVARCGTVDLEDRNATENIISRLIVHPDFLPPITGVSWARNDIGIVVLKDKLTLGDRLSAIALPTKQPGRVRASLAGWGDISENPVIEPTILQTAEVQVIDNDECENMGFKPRINPPSNPQFICGYQENGYVLNGDSGSPLTSGGEVIGVVSWGFSVRRIPDFYMNVYHYLDWIKSIVHESTD